MLTLTWGVTPTRAGGRRKGAEGVCDSSEGDREGLYTDSPCSHRAERFNFCVLAVIITDAR